MSNEAPDEPRVFRVTLCEMRFSEIDVKAVTPLQAEHLAKAAAAGASLKFFTVPNPMRVEKQIRSKPSDPASPLVWVEAKEEKW